jgi:hypothetical protein
MYMKFGQKNSQVYAMGGKQTNTLSKFGTKMSSSVGHHTPSVGKQMKEEKNDIEASAKTGSMKVK